jgi:hypothetical protein
VSSAAKAQAAFDWIKPAAIGAAGDLARADQEPIRIASCGKARFETPWQDRWTLLLFASQ